MSCVGAEYERRKAEGDFNKEYFMTNAQERLGTEDGILARGFEDGNLE